MVDLCHPLGWQSGWQVCAPYIPSHSPLAARLPPNQKILQDIMRYAPKVDRWLLRSAETSMLPSFPLPSFSSPLVQSAEYGSRMWFFGGKVPLVLVHRSEFSRAPKVFLDFLPLGERTRIVRLFFFFEHWGGDSAEISGRKRGLRCSAEKLRERGKFRKG